MDLKELIKDIDYQNEYSYEERVDLFNKYSYSTTHKFFVPIYELAWIIYDECLGFTSNHHAHSFGHGQQVLKSTLMDDVLSEKEQRIKIGGYGNAIIVTVGVAEKINIKFILGRKAIIIKTKGSSVEIPRDLYEKIDEWLTDLGYEKW